MHFIWYIIIGTIAGAIAGKLMRGGGFGLLMNLIIGIAGGIVGGWLFALLGFAATGTSGNLITSVAGAVGLLWFTSLFKRAERSDI